MRQFATALFAGLALAGCQSAQVAVEPALRADRVLIGKVRSVQEQTVFNGVAEIWTWIVLELPTEPATETGFFRGANCAIDEPLQRWYLVIVNKHAFGFGEKPTHVYDEASVCIVVSDATADQILKYAPRDTRR